MKLGTRCKRTLWLLALLMAVPAGQVLADDAQQAQSGAEGGEQLVARLKALRPDIPIQRVSRSPLPGIYQLDLAGGTVFYGTADGRYLFAGDLYELGDDDLVNLAEQGRISKRQELMAAVDPKDMVIFPADGQTKAVIDVFTDVDCGYCRKLHKEVPKLNKMGVEVRYLAYPRAGIGSRSYEKIVSAWCSDDPQSAITALKAGKEIPDKTCPNPVADEYALGQQVGVSGTPAIVLEDGRLLPGYMPADDLAATLGI
ncbi:MAG: thioredoxin fold domain-containing protein [Pseudomonadales bacterium]|jgi:thiol:disulfide interchange protein DsbC